MIAIRPAVPNDVDAVCAFDVVAQREDGRREFIRQAVEKGTCYVAVAEPGVVGYGVLDYTFYRQGCVEMLYVADGQRRRGVGTTLIEHLEGQCQTPKVFTSTNLSNLPMQALLAKRGYMLSGVIHNLDEGDPEIVYCKRLR